VLYSQRCNVGKLHQILIQNPAGVLVLRDELTGWLANLERPGREGERAFFLECWNGDGCFDIDRIARGTVRVECGLSLSFRRHPAGAPSDIPRRCGDWRPQRRRADAAISSSRVARAECLRWRRDGKELFYLGHDGRLYAVPITLSTKPKIGAPVPLFAISTQAMAAVHSSVGFDVSPDGRRFLVPIVTSPERSEIVVIQNWEAALKLDHGKLN
jgi:hypothetical protein